MGESPALGLAPLSCPPGALAAVPDAEWACDAPSASSVTITGRGSDDYVDTRTQTQEKIPNGASKTSSTVAEEDVGAVPAPPSISIARQSAGCREIPKCVQHSTIIKETQVQKGLHRIVLPPESVRSTRTAQRQAGNVVDTVDQSESAFHRWTNSTTRWLGLAAGQFDKVGTLKIRNRTKVDENTKKSFQTRVDLTFFYCRRTHRRAIDRRNRRSATLSH